MNVYVFGGTLSPNYSNYALRRAARDHERKYGKEVAEWIISEIQADES